MAVPEPLGLTRRTVLTGAAALFAAGTAGLTVPRPARAAALPQIRAAAAGWIGRGGELLVLTADPATETDFALRLLTAAADPEGTAELGPSLPLPLPAGFHPHSMAALGDALWITGAVERVPGEVRPALIWIDEATAEYAELPVPKAIRSGIATAIAPVGDRGLAVVIEGCPDPHLTAISRSHLAVSKNHGRTWTGRPLASGLGEGYGTVLTETDHGLFIAVVDGDGTQTVRTTGKTGVLKQAARLPDAGRPMAAVAASDHVSVFSDRDGTVAQTRFTAEGDVLESSPDCGCRGEILAVPGRRGTWLETDGSTIHIRSTD
ncbi:hypothetical protein [Glycomyces rhizosphaerae]|uniref:Uncharacterized protein n=1 Tax=Glycomyces rhizosphaerae TaxID=2054422 RepID=A0ABV7Q0Q4_9ACTN